MAPLNDAGIVVEMIKQFNGVVALIGFEHADNLVEALGKLGYKLVAEDELMSDKIVKAVESE